MWSLVLVRYVPLSKSVFIYFLHQFGTVQNFRLDIKENVVAKNGVVSRHNDLLINFR